MEFYPAKPGNANKVQAGVWRYSIPLAKPIRAGSGMSDQREGLLVGLRTASGAEGWGEIAPLEGLFSETLDQAREITITFLKRLGEANNQFFGSDQLKTPAFKDAFFLEDPFWSLVLPDFQQVPSVRSGLEMAFCSLAAAEQGVSLFHWLGGAGSAVPTKTSLLLEAGTQSFLDEGADAYERGFRFFKIKIARTDAHLEQDAVRRLVECFPEIRLRLDANRNLNESEFKGWVNASAHWPVEYWEEPLRDVEALGHFEGPFAIDESLRKVTASVPKNDWEARLDQLPDSAGVWIVKPAMLGTLRALFYLSELAMKKKKKMVLSSTFESRLGLSFWAEVSAGLKKSSGEMVSGLGTLDYFSRDLCVPGKTRAEPEFPSMMRFFSSVDLNGDLTQRVL